jgi:hypothetical protein
MSKSKVKGLLTHYTRTALISIEKLMKIGRCREGLKKVLYDNRGF